MKKILLMLLVTAAMSATMYADDKSGSCGDGLNWKIDGVQLTISGSDVAMTAHERGQYPWSKFADDIYILRIENGTNIPEYAFADLKDLSQVYIISKKMKIMGEYAFAGCNPQFFEIYAEQKIAAPANAFEGFSLKEGEEAGKANSLAAYVYVSYELFTTYFLDAVWLQFQLYSFNQMYNLSGTQGTCKYAFDEKTGVVTISPMDGKEEGEFSLETPWESPYYMNQDVKKVIVEEGVTAIGTGAFIYCDNLETIVLPSTMYMMAESSSGETVFQYFPFDCCKNLHTIECYSKYPPDYPNGTSWYGINPPEINLLVQEEAVSYYKDEEAFWGIFNIGILPAIASGELEGGLGWRLSAGGRLTITGEGAMPNWTSPSQAPWYKYMKDINVVSISYGVTSVSDYAFKGAENVMLVVIASNYVTIGKEAFAGTTELANIACYNYGFIPKLDATSLPEKDITVWVLTDKDDFERDAVWGKYTIELMGADNAYIETDNIAATSLGFDNIAIIWKALTEADQYKITIVSEDHSFQCTITFDAHTGDILGVSKAPKHTSQHATMEKDAWSYRFYGLEAGKKYSITVVAMKEGTVLETYKTDINTYSTGVEQIEQETKAQKVMRDGQLLIQHAGKTYNVLGAETVR